MSNLVDYAKDELKRIGMIDSKDPYNEWVTKAILDLIELFASQDHSGFTASYVINAFNRLARFKPLSPLTGKDNEWNELKDGLYQNKRYSAVFKNSKDGIAYNIEGKAFTDDGEIWYTSRDSKVNVTFPYTVPDKPERVYRNKEVEMTLDEAIKHEEELVDGYDRIKQIKAVTLEECKCAEEHRQLADLLKDYKLLKEQEPCTDAISRQAVLEYIEGSEAELGHYSENELVCQYIKGLPPVTPQPKIGHWIKISPAGIYECSECGKSVLTSDICAYMFCHGCGTKMLYGTVECNCNYDNYQKEDEK